MGDLENFAHNVESFFPDLQNYLIKKRCPITKLGVVEERDPT